MIYLKLVMFVKWIAWGVEINRAAKIAWFDDLSLASVKSNTIKWRGNDRQFGDDMFKRLTPVHNARGRVWNRKSNPEAVVPWDLTHCSHKSECIVTTNPEFEGQRYQIIGDYFIHFNADSIQGPLFAVSVKIGFQNGKMEKGPSVTVKLNLGQLPQ